MDSVPTVVWLVIGFTLALILFFKKKFSYWRERGVIYVEPKFPLGNLPIGKHFKELVVDAYNLKNQTPVAGVFVAWRPLLVTTSLDLIRNILVKDFSSFHERCAYVNEKIDPLSAQMFSLDGERWKSIRTKLSPTFTSGKMKFMFGTFVEVADRFNDALGELTKSGLDVEIKDLLGRFTTDVIGSCAFGVECNSLKDPDAVFRHYGRKVFEEPHLPVIVQIVVTVYPEMARRFNVRLFGKDVCEFFTKSVQDTIAYREENNVHRNDFMDLLIQMKDEPSTKLSVAEIVAQSFLFFMAGFETSSTTMTFALYELARNPDIQERGRREIEEVLEKHNGKLTYEAVHEMAYIDNIITESIRKYPPLVFIVRKAARDYPVPNTNIVIEKGMDIVIPVYAIQNDPELFPKPDVFDPDRFTPENIKARHPLAFLGFGDGPRNCIGMRFAKMQSRIGLITLLKNYRFETCSKTQIPLEFDPVNEILSVKGGLYLKVSKI